MIENFLKIKQQEKILSSEVDKTTLSIFFLYSIVLFIFSFILAYVLKSIMLDNIQDVFYNIHLNIVDFAKSSYFGESVYNLVIPTNINISDANNINDIFHRFFLYYDEIDVSHVSEKLNVFTQYSFVFYFSIMILLSLVIEKTIFKGKLYLYPFLFFVLFLFISFIQFVNKTSYSIISESYNQFENIAIFNLSVVNFIQYFSILFLPVFIILLFKHFNKFSYDEYSQNLKDLDKIKKETKCLKDKLFKSTDNIKELIELYKKEQDSNNIKLIEKLLDEYKDINKEKFKRINEFENILKIKESNKKNVDILIKNE